MKVSFRCKQSNNVVSFVHEQDIAWMRKEAGYEEIKDEIKTETIATQEIAKSIIGNPDEGNDAEDVGQEREENAKVLKKRGRPRIVEQDVI